MNTEETTESNGKPNLRAVKAPAKEKAPAKAVTIKKLNLQKIEIGLWGTSPLIMHAWSRKAKEQMLAKQMKTATAGKEAKDPQRDFEEATYRDEHGLVCFPSIAFKAAAVNAAVSMDFKKTNLRQAFRIPPDMLPIYGSEPIAREDMVRIAMGTADIRYRPEFRKWGTIVPVELNVNILSPEQLVALFESAGFGIGIGEWRMERDGQFGCFKVANDVEMQELRKYAAHRDALIEEMGKDKT